MTFLDNHKSLTGEAEQYDTIVSVFTFCAISLSEFIKPSAERMSYVYSLSSQQSKPSARNMLLIDELFLFLVRIRLGLYEQDLAHRFNISISSVSRKVTTWANYLYFALGTQPIWASREMVDEHMPQGFKDLYPTTWVILDC